MRGLRPNALVLVSTLPLANGRASRCSTISKPNPTGSSTPCVSCPWRKRLVVALVSYRVLGSARCSVLGWMSTIDSDDAVHQPNQTAERAELRLTQNGITIARRSIPVDEAGGREEEASRDISASARVMIDAQREQGRPLCRATIDRICRCSAYVDELLELPPLYRPSIQELRSRSNVAAFDYLVSHLSTATRACLYADSEDVTFREAMMLQYMIMTLRNTDNHTRLELQSAQTMVTDAASRIPHLYKSCAACGDSLASNKRCSRCKRVYYCSPRCQRADWANHRSICVPTTEFCVTQPAANERAASR